MKEFKSHSQSGQDRFAYELIGENGNFLDIGANHPTEKNNTWGLEKIGWRGLLIEQDDYCVDLCREYRISPVIKTDAAETNWTMICRPLTKFDYISLDVDSATAATLKGLLGHGIKFDVLTVEHDKYRFGPLPQAIMREHLEGAGYKLICGDVCDDGLPFEDWWVSEKVFDRAKFYKKPDGAEWKEIFK